jgi:hypothetical protein
MLYSFCKSYSYKNGCNIYKNNCMNIYYNLQLLLNDLRLGFLLQPIDYYYYKDYECIVKNIVFYIWNKNIEYIEIAQGLLFYKKCNNDIIDTVKNELNNMYNHKLLGKILSYPCWYANNNLNFISFIVIDKYGQHQLISNWYETYFDSLVFRYECNKWKKYLENKFNCTCSLIENI